MMQLFPHLQNNDTAYVSVRLNKDEEMSLRLYMHVSDKFQNVAFPHGVRLFYRSMGWYRLDTSNTFRASEKLKLGISIIRRWYAEYSEQRKQELRLLMLKAQPELEVSGYLDGRFVVRNKQTQVIQSVDAAYSELQQKMPATPDRLKELAQRFSR
jgi:hypothetical protein